MQSTGAEQSPTPRNLIAIPTFSYGASFGQITEPLPTVIQFTLVQAQFTRLRENPTLTRPKSAASHSLNTETNPHPAQDTNRKESESKGEACAHLPGVERVLELLKPAVGGGADGGVRVVVQRRERLLHRRRRLRLHDSDGLPQL